MIALPTLYSRTQTGAIQQWTIFVEGDGYYTTYGQVRGKHTTTLPTKTVMTNAGRANQRDPADQAMFEAQAIWKKKAEFGYFEDIARIDDECFEEPMRAQDYFKRLKKLIFPVYSQPKLDGIRCILSKDFMKSRKGKFFFGAPHIARVLITFFERFPETVLDGELYCNKFNDNFNAICSIVKKQSPSPAELAMSEETMQYWVYDLVDLDKGFAERSAWLDQNLPKDIGCIVHVPTLVANSFEELDRYYEQYVEDGYEGGMIRTDEPYSFTRAKCLLKRKEFEDAEYKILEVCEGLGKKTGITGYMWMLNHDVDTTGLPDGWWRDIAQDDTRAFKTNIKGNYSYLRELWEDRLTIPGNDGTVKYFRLTPAGIPRFPYLIAIRNYE